MTQFNEGEIPAFRMSFFLVAIGASVLLFNGAFKEADPHAVVTAATNYATLWLGVAGVKLLSLVGGISAVAFLCVRLKKAEFAHAGFFLASFFLLAPLVGLCAAMTNAAFPGAWPGSFLLFAAVGWVLGLSYQSGRWLHKKVGSFMLHDMASSEERHD